MKCEEETSKQFYGHDCLAFSVSCLIDAQAWKNKNHSVRQCVGPFFHLMANTYAQWTHTQPHVAEEANRRRKKEEMERSEINLYRLLQFSLEMLKRIDDKSVMIIMIHQPTRIHTHNNNEANRHRLNPKRMENIEKFNSNFVYSVVRASVNFQRNE